MGKITFEFDMEIQDEYIKAQQVLALLDRLRDGEDTLPEWPEAEGPRPGEESFEPPEPDFEPVYLEGEIVQAEVGDPQPSMNGQAHPPEAEVAAEEAEFDEVALDERALKKMTKAQLVEVVVYNEIMDAETAAKAKVDVLREAILSFSQAATADDEPFLDDGEPPEDPFSDALPDDDEPFPEGEEAATDPAEEPAGSWLEE
jgi:hypothetical protein